MYIISRLKGFPQIVTNLQLIEDFLPDAVQLTNRYYYHSMLASSVEFLLSEHKKMKTETMKIDVDKSRANIEKIKER